jgi:hypothetical protein
VVEGGVGVMRRVCESVDGMGRVWESVVGIGASGW